MRLTKQYANGLLAAVPADVSVELYNELTHLSDIFKELSGYISSIDMYPKEFQYLRNELEGSYHPLVLNFLQVLAEDGMLNRLDTVIEDYKLGLVENNLLYDVRVFSATPLSDNFKNNLETFIQNRWGKNYVINYRVDRYLIGGVRIEVNGTVIDTTFRSRIDQILREV